MVRSLFLICTIKSDTTNVINEALGQALEEKLKPEENDVPKRYDPTFEMVEIVFNAELGNTRPGIILRFTDPATQLAFSRAQSIYWSRFNETLEKDFGITGPPDISKVNFKDPMALQKYNIAMAVYNLKVSIVEQKIGKSPAEIIIKAIKGSKEVNISVTKEINPQILPVPEQEFGHEEYEQ